MEKQTKKYMFVQRGSMRSNLYNDIIYTIPGVVYEGPIVLEWFIFLARSTKYWENLCEQ